MLDSIQEILDRCQTVLEAQNPIPALGHNVKNGTVTKEPTCTEDGEQVGTCERCGATDVTGKVGKLGHEETTVCGTAPTCAESGWSDSISCDRCGAVLQERTPLAPLGQTVDGSLQRAAGHGDDTLDDGLALIAGLVDGIAGTGADHVAAHAGGDAAGLDFTLIPTLAVSSPPIPA